MSIQQSAFKNMIVARKEHLLEKDQAGFVFATPTGTISSKKLLKNISFSQHPDLSFQPQLKQWLEFSKQELNHQIQHSDNPELIIVGSLPFDARDLPELSIAEAKNTYLSSQSERIKGSLDSKGIAARLVPENAVYMNGVSQLIQMMQKTELEKAVLARAIDLEVPEKIDIVELFYRLFEANPEGYTFALAQQPKQHGWFVGASPELLIAKQNENIFSHPVAGTLPRMAEAAEDNAQADRLLASAKDQHEHALVIEAIADQLNPLCRSLTIPKRPSLIKTQTLWHLATRIQGVLKDPETHVFDLISILHPTPAVCGQPAPLARQLISELEPFQRNLFAGTMGWSDADGNGAWAVNVRCGRVHEQSVRLYAGAGIVEASTPEHELHETAAKFKTMFNALGLNAEELTYI